jgi:chaperonin GroES
MKKKSSQKAKPAKKTKPIAKKATAKVATQETNLVFSPLGDRVLIIQADAFDKTPGGLFIPATVVDKPLRGKVLAVGTGTRNKKGVIRPLDVHIGDEVMFGKYAGSEIKINNKNYLLVSEAEIIGVVTK